MVKRAREEEYRFEEEEEEEVQLREGEEFEEESIAFEIRGETPSISPPAIVLSVTYDGKAGKALVKLYDPVNDKVYFWYDNTGHRPYLLTDIDPRDIVMKFPRVVQHRGFSHIELVRKYDALNDRDVVMTKVCAKDPLSIGGARESIRDILPKTWESKIKYHLCYIYDNDVVPGMFYKIENGKLVKVEIEIPPEVRDFVHKLYGDDEHMMREVENWLPLFQAPVPHIKRLAIDIEVFTPKENKIPKPEEATYEIISIALAGSDGLRRVLVLRRPGLELTGEQIERLRDDDVEIFFFDSEYEMLREFFKIVCQYPLIITFNGDNFDLKYIYNRALKLGFRKDEIPIISKRDEMTIALGVHIDLYKFFNIRAIETYAFGGKYRGAEKTLDTIASALVKMKKIPRDKPISEMDYAELINYNFRDAFLTLYLTMYDNELVMKLIILLSRISKLPLDDITRSQVSAWIKNMMYYEHRRKGWLIPEKEDIINVKGEAATKAIIKGKKYLGAIVIDPVPGIFPNVCVIDFASLYPSIIKKWNLSYETVRCPDETQKNNRPYPDLPHWVCYNRRGLTSTIIGILRDMRVYVYKKIAKTTSNPVLKQFYDVVQSALKVFINASYGVFGAETFQLYCPPVAELVTALGRLAMSMTLIKAIEIGLVPLYGDTDSLFIWSPDEKKLKELIEWVEETLGIDIDVDKVYRLVAMSGRKKNYIGILPDGSLDIKGMVGKKRNTPDFVKEAFSDVLKIISTMEKITDVQVKLEEIRRKVKEYYDQLRRREIPLNKLTIRMSLNKPLEQYTKNKPQHVKAALQLKQYGINVGPGDIIYFVKTRTKDGVKPVQLARIDEVDVDKYVDYLKTSLEQVLDALGISFDEVLGATKLSLI
ncbi:MAG: DNA-directed DNA polymerase I [Crenarchaeota archaeon]|nr:DNA-directed DNA polymerase I [Thermoproteota archaeon]